MNAVNGEELVAANLIEDSVPIRAWTRTKMKSTTYSRGYLPPMMLMEFPEAKNLMCLCNIDSQYAPNMGEETICALELHKLQLNYQGSLRWLHFIKFRALYSAHPVWVFAQLLRRDRITYAYEAIMTRGCFIAFEKDFLFQVRRLGKQIDSRTPMFTNRELNLTRRIEQGRKRKRRNYKM